MRTHGRKSFHTELQEFWTLNPDFLLRFKILVLSVVTFVISNQKSSEKKISDFLFFLGISFFLAKVNFKCKNAVSSRRRAEKSNFIYDNVQGFWTLKKKKWATKTWSISKEKGLLSIRVFLSSGEAKIDKNVNVAWQVSLEREKRKFSIFFENYRVSQYLA